VGEVRSALPLVKALRQRLPERSLAFSVATAQGLKVAAKALEGMSGVSLFVRPLDLPWAARRLLDVLRPGLFCLVEGDIWPGWQWALRERGVPRLLINGRVSPRTARGYARLGGLALDLLHGFDRLLMQSEHDRRRLLEIGVEPRRLAVAGNLKFDSAPSPLGLEQRAALAREWGLAGRRVLVAGSTHAGEEEACLEAMLHLGSSRPDLSLILAPREVRRGPQLARLARERGLTSACLSQGRPPEGVEVLVLDVLGRLAPAYALAQAALVGGSLVPVGGHNLLEPAAQGVPVLFGPHTHNFVEMAQGLLEAGGGLRLAEDGELTWAWQTLLADATRRETMGKAAQEFCQAHRGALNRVLAEMESLLSQVRS
jgi:3-deoxy-D-manno-octulosonic-acid transferase